MREGRGNPIIISKTCNIQAEIPYFTRPPDFSGKMKSRSSKIKSRHQTSCLVKTLAEVFVYFKSK